VLKRNIGIIHVEPVVLGGNRFSDGAGVYESDLRRTIPEVFEDRDRGARESWDCGVLLCFREEVSKISDAAT